MEPSEFELDAAQQLICSEADPASDNYRHALATLRAAVESGRLEFAETLAETYAFSAPNRDPELAYVFYYVSFAMDSFSVALDNQSTEPGHYLGAIGDFRNEAQVSDLIQELGVAALPALDAKAASILATVA
jgi:hypothetical protein